MGTVVDILKYGDSEALKTETNEHVLMAYISDSFIVCMEILPSYLSMTRVVCMYVRVYVTCIVLIKKPVQD